MHVSFLRNFFSISFFFPQKKLRNNVTVESSELPFCCLPHTPSIIEDFPSTYNMICLLLPSSKCPLYFSLSEVPLIVSYGCGASVGGVAVTARVF